MQRATRHKKDAGRDLITALKAIVRGGFNLYSPASTKFVAGYLFGEETGE